MTAFIYQPFKAKPGGNNRLAAMCCAKGALRPSLCISLVRNFQPSLHFIVNICQRSYLETMRDPISLLQAAGVDKSPRCLPGIAQRETKIDARLRSRLDLREDVIAIQRHDSLTGTRLNVFARF